ncbi:MAG: polysaccharide biosynthesis tyrosine autokinase [Desulfobacterales bacterium]|jgi:capsular exopolysaccharide synthesis family protein|nr:polysaccharide biosynthesis tyrosine autokinase [Desulfobacterales bacterium]
MIETEKEAHLRDYLRVVLKRKNTILAVFIIVFTAVLIKTYSDTPLYKASATVLIEKSEPTQIITNYAYTPFDPEFLETQSHIIKSTSVAEKVVRLLDLEKSYDSFSRQHAKRLPVVDSVKTWIDSLVKTIKSLFGVTASEASFAEGSVPKTGRSKTDEIAAMISGNIVVSPVRDSKILSINFTSPNPVLASLITNTVAKAYIEQILDMRMQSSGYSIGWMTRKADEERKKMAASEKALQDYIRASDIITIEDRLAILPQKLTELSQNLTQAQSKRREIEALYAKVSVISNQMDEAETISIIADNLTLQSLNQQILKTEQKIVELSKKCGPKHPIMKNAQKELAVFRQKREREITHIIKKVANELELVKSAEEDFKRLLADTKAQTVNLNERFIQYGMLQREVETNRNLYNALMAKIKEQSVTEQIQTVNVWVVEEAKTPEFPSSPNIKRNLLLGIFLGLIGGVGLALFLEYLDNTIKLPEDVQDVFGVPALGLVSLLKEKEKIPEKMMITDSASAFAEAFKSIRTAVQLSSHDAMPKQILITSTAPQDGKTTIAVNLSVAMSQMEKRVLLIDADLRRPSIHKIFELENTKGLSTFLTGVSDKDIIQKGPADNFFVIPSGPIPPNPSELLGSERFKVLLAYLSEKFDLIIIDSPPLLSVADGLVISKLAAGTILVMRSGKTTYESAYKVLKSMEEIETKVLGVVINAADLKKSGYYYYNDYSYHYSSEDGR